LAAVATLMLLSVPRAHGGSCQPRHEIARMKREAKFADQIRGAEAPVRVSSF
jgi:hypothetical protein